MAQQAQQGVSIMTMGPTYTIGRPSDITAGGSCINNERARGGWSPMVAMRGCEMAMRGDRNIIPGRLAYLWHTCKPAVPVVAFPGFHLCNRSTAA